MIMFMKLCGFLHDIQNFPTNWVVFTNNMLYMFSSAPQRKCYGCFLNSNTIVKLELHFVTWSHHKYHKNSRLLFLDDNLPVWPPSLNCGRLLTQASDAAQQLSVLTATVAGPGPGTAWRCPACLAPATALRALSTYNTPLQFRSPHYRKKQTQHILILKE